MKYGYIERERRFLAMAEVEPPDFCTVEVTNDPFFTGGHLATVQADILRQALLIRFQAYDVG